MEEYIETLKAARQNAIDQQEQEQQEDFYRGQEEAFDYALKMLSEHEQSRQAAVSGALPRPKVPKEFCQCKNPLFHDVQCPCGNDR